MLQPDYHNWILPVALVGFLTFSRWDVYFDRPWSGREAALLAMYAALATAIKPTLAIYPVTIAVAWLIGRPRLWNSLIKSASAAVTGICGFILILLLYYHGNLSHLGSFFH